MRRKPADRSVFSYELHLVNSSLVTVCAATIPLLLNTYTRSEVCSCQELYQFMHSLGTEPVTLALQAYEFERNIDECEDVLVFGVGSFVN